MPKKLLEQRINENLTICVQQAAGAKAKPYWHAVIKFPRQEAVWRSTKVLYEADSVISLRKATDKALELVKPFQARWERGNPVAEVFTITRLGDEYLAEAERKSLENEELVKKGLPRLHPVKEGRGEWGKYRYDLDFGIWNKHLHPYLMSVQEKMGRTLSLDEWDDRMLRGFPDWCRDNYPNHSPATFNHWNQVLNRLFRYALNRDLINRAPKLKGHGAGSLVEERKRMRREITPEEFKVLCDALINRVHKGNEQMVQHWRDYQYLLYLFIIIIAGTGIRPPTGKTRHTMLRWEDVKIDGANENSPVLERRTEKDHSYTAVILPDAAWAFRELRRFYEAKGFDCSSGFVFRHTWSRDVLGRAQFNKGDNIDSFRSQFERVTKELGLRGDTGKQSGNVSFSSLRAYYITQRLILDPDVRIEELAQVVGTKPEQIFKRYYRFRTEEHYEKMSKGAVSVIGDNLQRVQHDKDGYDYAVLGG